MFQGACAKNEISLDNKAGGVGLSRYRRGSDFRWSVNAPLTQHGPPESESQNASAFPLSRQSRQRLTELALVCDAPSRLVKRTRRIQ